MTDNTETPLIWTTKGNLPESELRFTHEWEDTPEYTAVILSYFLGDELVKCSKHVYNRQPLEMFGEIPTL